MKNIIKILVATLLIASLLGITSCASPVDSPVAEPETYKIAFVAESTGGKIDVSPIAEAIEGKTVTIIVNPDEDYVADAPKVIAVSDNTEVTVKKDSDNEYSFTMPDSDVEIEVSFTEIESDSENETTNDTAEETESVETVEEVVEKEYTITIVKNNTKASVPGGTVEIKDNITTAKEGEEITVIVNPSEGYKFSEIFINGTALKGTTFKMPANDVEISVKFSAIEYIVNYPAYNENIGAFTKTYKYGDKIETKFDVEGSENVAYIKYTTSAEIMGNNNVTISNPELYLKAGAPVEFYYENSIIDVKKKSDCGICSIFEYEDKKITKVSYEIIKSLFEETLNDWVVYTRIDTNRYFLVDKLYKQIFEAEDIFLNILEVNIIENKIKITVAVVDTDTDN